MADDRVELLRTQTVAHVLTALGAGQIACHGNDPMAGGVFLDDDSTVTSRTYWTLADESDATGYRKYEYSVRVSVEVTRRAVSSGR